MKRRPGMIRVTLEGVLTHDQFERARSALGDALAAGVIHNLEVVKKRARR